MLIFISLFVSCTNRFSKFDFIIGKTFNEATLKLGLPVHTEKFVLDTNYKPKSEIEPDFLHFFTNNDINHGIEVYYFCWEMGNQVVYAWATDKKNNLIIFESIYCNMEKEKI